MTALLTAVRRYAEAHADRSGWARMPIRGLSAIRATSRSRVVRSLPQPLVCLILQGAKHVVRGNRAATYRAGDSMVVSADVPSATAIIDASVGVPYVALALHLEPALVAELTVEMSAGRLAGGSTDGEVADTALRVVRLLERPDALPVLSSQIVREMHYWLLMGRHGNAIRRVVRADSNVQKVARAVAHLRGEFACPVSIETLAGVAGMSPSSLHRHFKAATSLSPLQFQKQLRLIEARRLMLYEDASASHAARSVGYESTSHFTRDYRRMFGLSPARDMRAAIDR